jgi:hypothetical protein
MSDREINHSKEKLKESTEVFRIILYRISNFDFSFAETAQSQHSGDQDGQ